MNFGAEIGAFRLNRGCMGVQDKIKFVNTLVPMGASCLLTTSRFDELVFILGRTMVMLSLFTPIGWTALSNPWPEVTGY